MARASGTRSRRHDPGRRDRIVDACLDVIAEVGVAGTSHRRVAEAADVPLGSMTYHFTGMDDLLHAAFTRFAHRTSEQINQAIEAAADAEAAKKTIADAITTVVFGSRRDLVLTQELYTLAARDPAYRAITNDWMARGRRSLEKYFDPTTARILDALIEGLTIHRALDNAPYDESVVTAAIQRVTAPAAPSRADATPSSSAGSHPGVGEATAGV